MATNNDVLAYIDGAWVEGPEWRDNIDPGDTRQVIGRSAHCGDAEARAAVEAAATAQPAWRDVPAPKRGAIVFRAMALMDARREELAVALSREEGKPVGEARGEVQKSINILEFLAGEGRRFGGDVIASELPSTFAYTVRQPLGVVSLISPWNFPVAIPSWKIAPALVAGNTVVFKPATLTPLTGRIITEIFVDAGVPKGVLNFVPGGGGTVGEAIVNHPSVRGVSFTGSNAVGMHLARQASAANKKCQCEMGGKNPLVLLADGDVEQAAVATLQGAFGSTGQRCTATSRAIVERPVYERFLERVVAGAREMKVGHGMTEGVDMGPSVDAGQFATVHEYIAIGRDEGARLVTGGHRLTGGDLKHGFYTDPTVFADVRPDMRIAQEEVFGPVLAVIAIDDFDQAVEVANGVRYGLSSSVYTHDLRLARRFIDRIDTGIVHVNSPTMGGESQLPFGGLKDTGVGPREQGRTAIEFYSELKTVYVDYTGEVRHTNVY